MKKIKVSGTNNVNWYNRSMIELTGKFYTILDAEWNNLSEYWVLTIKAAK